VRAQVAGEMRGEIEFGNQEAYTMVMFWAQFEMLSGRNINSRNSRDISLGIIKKTMMLTDRITKYVGYKRKIRFVQNRAQPETEYP
jgi:hypothetical protein